MVSIGEDERQRLKESAKTENTAISLKDLTEVGVNHKSESGLFPCLRFGRETNVKHEFNLPQRTKNNTAITYIYICKPDSCGDINLPH